MAVPPAVLARERAFASSFARAALRGIALDYAQVSKLTAEHEESRAAARQRVIELSGGHIQNPKSSPQVSPYLVSQGYDLPLSERTGRPGAGKGALEPYAYLGDELAAEILRYRRDDTALTLLLEPRKLLCEHGDGRVRTSILTLAANTGRTSSRNENLQQVSRQGGMRACHRADDGYLIVSADLASVEIRTAAALSGDYAMQEMIRLGDQYPEKKKEFDFHWRTAVTVWGEDATKENRYTAKRVNFARLYGSAPKGCAALVGIPLAAARRVFDAFDTLAPQYGLWDTQMREWARAGAKSYTTYSGRDIYLAGKGEHAVGNAAIQGTAREFLLDGVLKWRQGPWKDCLIIPVHDEVLAFDVPEKEAEDATAFLVQCLERDFMGVQVKAEPNAPSPVWADASLRSYCQVAVTDTMRVMSYDPLDKLLGDDVDEYGLPVLPEAEVIGFLAQYLDPVQVANYPLRAEPLDGVHPGGGWVTVDGFQLPDGNGLAVAYSFGRPDPEDEMNDWKKVFREVTGPAPVQEVMTFASEWASRTH